MVKNAEKYRYVFQPAKIHESIFQQDKKKGKINIGVAKEQKKSNVEMDQSKP